VKAYQPADRGAERRSAWKGDGKLGDRFAIRKRRLVLEMPTLTSSNNRVCRAGSRLTSSASPLMVRLLIEAMQFRQGGIVHDEPSPSNIG
jgi:hypothetical protein